MEHPNIRRRVRFLYIPVCLSSLVKFAHRQFMQICCRIRGLTGSWKIPGAVMSLVVAQIGNNQIVLALRVCIIDWRTHTLAEVGCIMWTVGTVAAKSPCVS
ncbi:hypothetical protein BS47DRAFT_1345537 [Hydnum rufescens UP504]|uniref:Uncharacterized protein n=1 Tax=Hydnum rufescens UP504 TaxID=1448309 RepID=A0A9P6DSQ0_9AGAM|nr:hypothetical protein BS47DRAFT_1345537 [Hydnum rufescens UP504]